MFDFDAYSNDTLRIIDEVFKDHKIPIEMEVYTTKERLEIQGGDEFDLGKLGDPKCKLTILLSFVIANLDGKIDPNNTPHVGGLFQEH